MKIKEGLVVLEYVCNVEVAAAVDNLIMLFKEVALYLDLAHENREFLIQIEFRQSLAVVELVDRFE